MKNNALKITPLGGLGEIGINCQLWETSEHALLIDCGIMFPDDQQLGIDTIIPPLDPILAKSDLLRAVVLTHGHEDHIGGVPWLVSFIKGLTIYGSPFTMALVEHKLKEKALLDRANLVPVLPHESICVGPITIECIPVSHSIPEAYALAATTPAGKIVHTGDFTIDPSPTNGVGTDLKAFAHFAGKSGIKLLFSDSTNAEEPGTSKSEQDVKTGFDHIFSQAQGRIVITTFASHIERIQTVLDMANAYDRTVVISGRSLIANIDRAHDLGLLAKAPNLVVDQDMPEDLPPEKTVILATGSQGEALSALFRIAKGAHRYLALQQGDTVIMSSRVIPGNARAVNRLINQMYRMGAQVFHNTTHTVHVSGHARRDELAAMISAVKPRYVIPIHGEYRHLTHHRNLALQCGIPEDRAILLEDGEPITLTPRSFTREEKIPAEPVLIDGKGVGDVGNKVLQERHLLANEGVVVLGLVLDEYTGEILQGPSLFSKGFIYEQHFSHLLEQAKPLVLEVIGQHQGKTPDLERLAERTRSTLRSFFRRTVGRDPVVVPLITLV